MWVCIILSGRTEPAAAIGFNKCARGAIAHGTTCNIYIMKDFPMSCIIMFYMLIIPDNAHIHVCQ